MEDILKKLKNKGNKAQLIPSFKKPERRLLSVFMAALELVPSYRGFILKNVNYNTGKISKYSSFMEPVFELGREHVGRPDGLVICERRTTKWSMFIEAKCGSSVVRADQMQDYMSLAQNLGIDAVLSISNEFTSNPHELTYHAASNRRKGRQVYHFPWAYIVAETHLFLENEESLNDAETALISELLRFFSESDSGVSTFDQMPKMWPEFVEFSKTTTGFNANTKGVAEVVNAWQQETRDLSLKLGHVCGERVPLKLSTKLKKDLKERTKVDRDSLTKDYQMSAKYSLPVPKHELEVTADLKACSISCQFKFLPPENKKAKACATWLLKSLEEIDGSNFRIIAKWPGRTNDTNLELDHFRQYEEEFFEGKKDAPNEIRLVRVFQDVRKFKSRKQFIDSLENLAINLLSDARASKLV
jgi:hypothetical protein